MSDVIPEVCKAIWQIIGPEEIPPLTEEEWISDAAEWERRWNFPHCLGKRIRNNAELRLWRFIPV